jgi:hypothetical protein
MRLKRDAALPVPFVISESGDFQGIDGNWSTFKLNVGSPAQEFQVLISTVGSVSWIPSYRPPDNACPWLFNDYPNPDDCDSERGIVSTLAGETTGFNSSNSNSWTPAGPGDLVLSDDMKINDYYGSNYSTALVWGTDTFLVRSNDGGMLDQDDVAFALNAENVNLFLGSIGLGFGTISFGQSQHFQTLMQLLSNSSKIPSASWGYAAGAHYEREYPSQNGTGCN